MVEVLGQPDGNEEIAKNGVVDAGRQQEDSVWQN